MMPYLVRRSTRRDGAFHAVLTTARAENTAMAGVRC